MSPAPEPALAEIRIVLVQPSHPGNIGAAARAMKTMGLSRLCLVAPLSYPHSEATALASGADDVLDAARVVPTLAAAVEGCVLVIGATARLRAQYHWPAYPVREAAAKLCAVARDAPVAVVFGTERTGLTNVELELCNAVLNIPANPDYESLNLAQAVQVVAYELYAAVGKSRPAPPREAPLAAAEDLALLYAHLDEVLRLVGFIDRRGGAHLLRRFKRVFARAELDRLEVNILRGLLAAVQDTLGRHSR
jgi:TrmH family RNA methyltransferase